MHFEVLSEDASGAELLKTLIPKVVAGKTETHSWRIHSYKGIGRIPKGLEKSGDPAKRILLDQLPRLLKGYGKTPRIDAVVVVLDLDKRDCREFLEELYDLAGKSAPKMQVMFRLAIEEPEAWYLGDPQALMTAYPMAKRDVLKNYKQDSVCGTWELLADAIHRGGSAAVRSAGWPLPGQLKFEWAHEIGPLLDLTRNVSPSFAKLRDGLSRLVSR